MGGLTVFLVIATVLVVNQYFKFKREQVDPTPLEETANDWEITDKQKGLKFERMILREKKE